MASWTASHLSLAVRGLMPSATVAINERSNALRLQGRTIHKLGLGQSPFPVPESVVEALRRHAHEKDYLPVKGLLALREAIAGYLHRTHALDRTAADVLVAPGSKELMFLLQVAFYGDLLLPTPAWVSYAPQAQIIGRAVQFLPMRAADRWCLDPEALDEHCRQLPNRPRVIILNYPSNPAGTTYSREQLEYLAMVCRRHDIIVLSDEIYGELHHRGEHVSIAPLYPEGTIVSTGLSKWCGAGGWRLGAFVFPRELAWLLDAMSAIASESYTSTSAPIQHAAVTAFDGGPAIEDYLSSARRVLMGLGDHVTASLRKTGAEVVAPDGAFYVFADYGPRREWLASRGITTSKKLAERLLEEAGVALLPGSDFGRSDYELTLRLAYVDFDGTKALAEVPPGNAPVDGTYIQANGGGVTAAMAAIEAFFDAS
jgi:aspartate aminotransferase